MELHIGRAIEQKFQESGLKLPAFAEKVNTGERNIYSIFKRKDISSEMLASISNALGFNFFKLYEQQLPVGLSEPEEKYKKRAKRVTVSLELTSEISNMEQFSKLLMEINESASKYGFQII